MSVPTEAAAVAEAHCQARTRAYRLVARAATPPLTDGRAGARIADIIAAWHPSSPPRQSPVPVVPR